MLTGNSTHPNQRFNYVMRSVATPRTFYARVEGNLSTLDANRFPGEWVYRQPNGQISPTHSILCRLLDDPNE